ncbi:MAG TPA: hypothetical protein VHD56_10005 [Tepidisphaeraceae bacterium]|nr:hypothetical protein [Tepidisphaeraceae bacterium]
MKLTQLLVLAAMLILASLAKADKPTSLDGWIDAMQNKPFDPDTLYLTPSTAAGPSEAKYLAEKAAADNADAEELAKKLSNPVASLISVPFQSNFDFNMNNGEGWRYTLNVQPVIPFALNDQWNLITRTIIPGIYQDDVVHDGGSTQWGMGDVTQSFFLSPRQSDPIWGVGPVFVWPTGTNDSLGSQKWSAGLTGLVLKQDGPWTYGVLANHVWSYAGEDDRPYVSSTFIQPFLAYNTKSGFGVTLQAESSYDWHARQWTIPVGLLVSQVMKFGNQPISLNFGPRVYVEGPDGAPEWGLRLTITFLFPK